MTAHERNTPGSSLADSPRVHPTAIVHPEARMGAGVRVDAYAVIEADVQVGEGSAIGAHAILHGGCRIGRNVQVAPHAVLGGAPQILGFQDRPSLVTIGDRSVVREYVTVHRSSREGGETRVGRDCFLMALCHVGHDCQLGDGVVLASYAGLSGHVEVGDRAVVGGQAGLHQFVRVGRLAMVGAASAVSKDVPPYVLATGNPCRARGLNVVGLRRANVAAEDRKALRKAYRVLYRSGLNTRQALAALRERMPEREDVAHLIAFVESSRRGITASPGRTADDG